MQWIAAAVVIGRVDPTSVVSMSNDELSFFADIYKDCAEIMLRK